MKYSVFHKIETRYKFFDRFCKRYIKVTDPVIRERLIESCEELMELIVKMLLDDNKEDLADILSKSNSKFARVFFDYFVGAKTKHMKKTDIVSTVHNYFTKENDMKDIHAFLEEAVKPIKLSKQYVPFKLNEAEGDEDTAPDADAGGDDMGDDPFAGGDDMGGDDMGGDDAGGDPFGGAPDAPGGGGGDSDSGDDEDGDAANGEEEDQDPYDMEGHEDDTDFTEGADDAEVVQPTPAGACIYDVKGIMQSMNAIIEALPDAQLAEIEAVKKAVTLIFNGKLLKAEDVTFQNPKNASFLLKKIGSNVNEKTRNYLMLKIKQPLIKLRDKNKEDLAAMKNDNDNIRDTLGTLDK